MYGKNNGDVQVRGIMYYSGEVKDSSEQGLLLVLVPNVLKH